MFNHHIDSMTELVVDKLLLSDVAKKQVRDTLAMYWQNHDAIVWSVEDVLDVCPGLTEAQAFDVLESVINNHDASLGVTWDSFTSAALRLYGEKALEDGAEVEDA